MLISRGGNPSILSLVSQVTAFSSRTMQRLKVYLDFWEGFYREGGILGVEGSYQRLCILYLFLDNPLEVHLCV